jgi:hypothetical protein
MNAPSSSHVTQPGVLQSAINSPYQEIKKMWPIIKAGDENPISLRAIPPKDTKSRLRVINKTFNAKDYPNIEDRKHAFETEALQLNSIGHNLYTPLNPIKPKFKGDKSNNIAVCDSDIMCRDCLLLDFDRAGKTDVPATDAEVDEARCLGDRITEYLSMQGWDKPIRVMSGNGHHLYYSLDHLPNDADSKNYVQNLLKWLAKKFNNDSVHIDTSVFNASRITKVPGTIARKGLEAEGRPYRMARVL